MADWEEFIISELDSDFVGTKATIVMLTHVSTKLRKGGTKCNALADKCDVVANRLRDRISKKGRHRAPSTS